MAKKRVVNRKRWFVVWLSNHTDCRDDEPVKIKARNLEEVRANLSFDSSRFSIARIFDGLSSFYKYHPDWEGLL